jgi:hypothetical protein
MTTHISEEYDVKEYNVNNINIHLSYSEDDIVISSEVNYVDYMKKFEEDEIKEMHFLFHSDIKYFFEMIQNPPFSIEKVDNEIEIKFYLDILGTKNIVSINIPEYVEEGSDKKMVVCEKRLDDIEILTIHHSDQIHYIWGVFLLYNVFYLVALVYLFTK